LVTGPLEWIGFGYSPDAKQRAGIQLAEPTPYRLARLIATNQLT
jgi:hypothetical protein